MMPYINSENGRREALVKGDKAQSAGELNFQIFSYVKHCPDNAVINDVRTQIVTYVENFLGKKRDYQKYNDMVGCLNCCYKEIFRRQGFYMGMLLEIVDSYDEVIAIYENLKIKENSDVA